MSLLKHSHVRAETSLEMLLGFVCQGCANLKGTTSKAQPQRHNLGQSCHAECRCCQVMPWVNLSQAEACIKGLKQIHMDCWFKVTDRVWA